MRRRALPTAVCVCRRFPMIHKEGACNRRLVADAQASDCHLAVGSRIRIDVPEEETWDAYLPEGGPHQQQASHHYRFQPR